ncbi:MAG: 4-alpha-glucanotransferase [Longimicrobiales bacterium]
MSAPDLALRRLARLYGVQPEYYDIEGRLRRASVEPLLEVLRALGARVTEPGDVALASRSRRLALWQRGLPPVVVAWDGRPPVLKLRRLTAASGTLRARLTFEDGLTREVTIQASPSAERTIAGQRFRVESLRLTESLPLGYHVLEVEAGGSTWRTRLIAAPRRAWRPADPAPDLGVFLPLHALRTARGWPTGDLTDLEALLRWAGSEGIGYVAVLPLLATFLGRPFSEPSPYAPASRLFWNELFADPAASEELARCAAARAELASAGSQQTVERLRDEPLVDYEHEYVLKRRALTRLARCFFDAGGEASREYQEFLTAYPEAARYAMFRAVCDLRGVPWPRWPAVLAAGSLDHAKFRKEDYRAHLYGQYLLHGQLTRIAQAATQGAARLFLDLPLGVHPDSYDVWAHRELFGIGVAAGAPPDPFISKGQNWGFPPLRPEPLRDSGYGYLIGCIRNHLRYAGALRIDHVMGLHRLFWIPPGREALDGVYVRYVAAELYAILTLESHRHKALIVGEDLGTVPPQVRRAMMTHGIRRMFVAQFELTDDSARPLGPVPPDATAYVNTHDMPPFAAFLQESDIRLRHELGWLDAEAVQRERVSRGRQRAALIEFLHDRGTITDALDPASVHAALAEHLATGAAALLMVNLEDLWGETEPQNVPGTWKERPNWRRRAALRFDEFCDAPGVLGALRRIHAARSARR